MESANCCYILIIMSMLDIFFNKGGKFLPLLEEAAQEVVDTANTFSSFIEAPSLSRHAEILNIRQAKEKQIIRRIESDLVRSYVTELERADIMILSEKIGFIPKTIALLAKHVVAAGVYSESINLSKQACYIEHASESALSMVRELRKSNSTLRMRNLLRKIKRYSARAEDDRMLLIQELYSNGYEPNHAMALRDMYDICSRIMNQFEDLALLIIYISLKNN